MSHPSDFPMFFGACWRESRDGAQFRATNPATGEIIGTVSKGSRADVRDALEYAATHKTVMAKIPIWKRAKLCRTLGDAVEKRAAELALILSQEQGKPYHSEAIVEVQRVAQIFHNAAELIKWLETEVITNQDPLKRTFTIRQPRGLYAIITPFNAPLSIAASFLAPALAAGNSCVWLPAMTTSACSVRLLEVLLAAGLPPEAINLLLGPGPEVGDELVRNPRIDAVAFTGSSATGQTIARNAAGKPLLLELGGNGPTIILDDADLSEAVPSVGVGCFSNAGQVCSSTERLLVHEAVYDAVVSGLVAVSAKIVLGDPLHPKTSMGPLNNEATVVKIEEHLEDATQLGARVLCGGARAEGFPTRLFFPPTVVVDVPVHSRLWNEETFGPVVPIVKFETDDEALEIGNRSHLGLTAAVFTRDINRAFYFAERLRAGIVNINERSNAWEVHTPAGGASGRQSGIGRIGGKQTFIEMTDLKTITFKLSPGGTY